MIEILSLQELSQDLHSDAERVAVTGGWSTLSIVCW